MPHTHNRRPPGRRDRRRPEGHALAPSQKKASKRDAVNAAIPTAQQAVDYLRDNGEDGMAAAVSTVIEYAANPVFGSPTPTLSLFVEKAFRDHVKTAVGAGSITAIVREGFEAFLAGTWLPPQPQRMPKGSKAEKASMSIRADGDLVKRVEAKGEEYAQEQGWSMAQGYKLNARQVAIAYLEHVYPMPEEAPAAK